MYRFIFKIPLLKSNTQINAMKLYMYFKKKYDLKKLGLKKEIIDSFLLQIHSLNIDEIIIVPDGNSDCIIKDVETIETGFLSTHTKFTDIQSEIVNEYYKLYKIPEDIRLFNIDNKDNIITKNTYFIKMSIG